MSATPSRPGEHQGITNHERDSGRQGRAHRVERQLIAERAHGIERTGSPSA